LVLFFPSGAGSQAARHGNNSKADEQKKCQEEKPIKMVIL